MIVALPLKHPLKPHSINVRQLKDTLYQRARRQLPMDVIFPYLALEGASSRSASRWASIHDEFLHVLPIKMVELIAERNFFDFIDEDLTPAKIDPETGKTNRERVREFFRAGIPKWDELNDALLTMVLDEDNPTLLRYYRQTPVGPREMRMSVSKFMQGMNHKHKFRWSPEDITRTSEMMSLHLREPKFHFELSDRIESTYREAYFGSCMRRSSSVRFYEKQGGNVQVLRIYNEDKSEFVGRCLVWHGVKVVESETLPVGSTVTVLDRVYPSDGGFHVRAAEKYAEENGWVYKAHHSVGGRLSEDGVFEVAIKDVGDYPYIDTFSFSDEDLTVLRNRRDADHNYEWWCTGNGIPHNGSAYANSVRATGDYECDYDYDEDYFDDDEDDDNDW